MPALSQDILKLYYEDYIAQWDSFLRDMRLAPLTDLTVASENLKDLSSADSALKRLVTAVVAETDLIRSEDEEPAGDNKAAKKGNIESARQTGQGRQAGEDRREAVAQGWRRRRKST